MAAKTFEIQIDPEFRDLIRPLTEKEFSQLEENVLSAGKCRDPLVIWNGLLLDGHHRLQIIQDHPHIEYAVDEIQLESRYDAIIWMCQNQRGKRNVTPEQGDYLMGKEYEADKMRQGSNNQHAQKSEKAQNELFHGGPNPTAAKIGSKYGVAKETVKRNANFAKGVDAIAGASPEAKTKILSGEVKIPKKDVREFHKLESPEIEEIAKQIESGTYRSPEPTIAPRLDRATERKQIKQHVAELKDDSIDRTITTSSFIVSYAGFVDQTIRSHGWDVAELESRFYAEFSVKEKKEMIALNNALLEVIKSINKNLEG